MIDADGRPLHLSWHYTRAELIADGVVHAIGIVLGLVGAVVLLALASAQASAGEIAAIAIYLAGLLAVLSISAAYNLWPVSRAKWWLRRFDHAMIYVLIAGTYTPFVTQFRDPAIAATLLTGVWTMALAGVAMKIALPGRFDRVAVLLYILLGMSALLTWDAVVSDLPGPTVWLIVIGGITYVAGVPFHFWNGMRFQNAVWHSFVLAATAVFYAAVLDGVVLATAA